MKTHLFILLLALGTAIACQQGAPRAGSWMEEQPTGTGNSEITLPVYFDQARVQAHTRMGLRWLKQDSILFYGVADHFKDLGVNVYTRHVKGGGEGAWWPSAIGRTAPQVGDGNIAKRIIDNAHDKGQKIVAYHRHMEDNYLAELHPDWVCRTPDGKRIETRGERLCFNSPYADLFLERAMELVELGVDGFYFDETHQPKEGCWCCYCRKKFKEETGQDIPERIDKNDQAYQELMDYKNLIIERTFTRYTKVFKLRNPDLVMIIGSNAWPSMADRHLTSRIWRFADIQKTEFELPVNATKREVHAFRFPTGMHPFNRELKMAHGWVLARDATGGRPPHVWVNMLLNEDAALFATSALLGHGCIANLDHKEGNIPDSMFVKAYDLGKRVSPYLAGTKPLRWVALHYSEHARDQYIGDGYSAWEHVLYPHYGAFAALTRERVPVGMITDSQLEDQLLDGYKILFVTEQQNLTPAMEKAIEVFVKKGGHVVYNDSTWRWHSKEGQATTNKKFMEKIHQTGEVPPVQVVGGPELMQTDQFYNRKKNQLTIACINDFSWVWTGYTDEIEERNPERYHEILNRQAPGLCSGVELVVKSLPGMQPHSVLDAVTELPLDYRIINDEIRVRLPSFEYLALVVMKFS